MRLLLALATAAVPFFVAAAIGAVLLCGRL
jgi:hypothetical protein